jgi:Xaa-Pro aminopeptidase
MSFPVDLPTIPRDEFPQRWRRVQTLMEAIDLDLLIAYADDRTTYGPAHARWLCDFPVMFEPVCVLLRRQGEPILLCGPESDEYAKMRARIADVRVMQEFTHPDEDYPYSTIHSLHDILHDLYDDLSSIRQVGVAGRALMNGDLEGRLHATLPDAAWLDVDQQVCMLRAVKSPAEIAVIRHAYRCAEAAMGAAFDTVAAGVTEREVACEADVAMRRLGAESVAFDTVVVSGPKLTRAILGRSTFRRIEHGDLVCITIAPRYEGYHAAIARPVFVGAVDDVVRRAFDVALDAQRQCIDALVPGVEGRAVDQLGRKVVGAGGFGEYYLYTGIHSVGVIEFEPPIFSSHNPTVVEPNMVISIDIPMFNAPWGGLRIEDGFLITANGNERLHHTPYRVEK